MDDDAAPRAQAMAQLWCLTDAAASACATPAWRPQRAAITWSVYAPEPRCDARPVPELAVPGGVRAAASEGGPTDGG